MVGVVALLVLVFFCALTIVLCNAFRKLKEIGVLWPYFWWLWFVNGKEFFNFKAKNKNINFPTQFCPGSISKGFGTTESREVSYKENVHCFLIGFKAIEKTHILNSYKYLIVKYNLK